MCREIESEHLNGLARPVPVRGLHFHWDPAHGGNSCAVTVDVRKGSPTLGRWYGREVSARNKLQMWAPAGFARGFCVLSDYAERQYMCTAIYNPTHESGLRWNDPPIAIDWPSPRRSRALRQGRERANARRMAPPPRGGEFPVQSYQMISTG